MLLLVAPVSILSIFGNTTVAIKIAINRAVANGNVLFNRLWKLVIVIVGDDNRYMPASRVDSNFDGCEFPRLVVVLEFSATLHVT